MYVVPYALFIQIYVELFCGLDSRKILYVDNIVFRILLIFMESKIEHLFQYKTLLFFL